MKEGGGRGGGTGTSDKQITLGRTWPGGHVLYCVGSRLTEIENRNRNQQKWNRKQMQNDVKRKPNRYRNTKTQRRGRERERERYAQGKARRRKEMYKAGCKRRKAELLSKKSISVSNVMQCHSRNSCCTFPLTAAPLQPRPLELAFAVCETMPKTYASESVCVCLTLCWPG